MKTFLVSIIFLLVAFSSEAKTFNGKISAIDTTNNAFILNTRERSSASEYVFTVYYTPTCSFVLNGVNVSDDTFEPYVGTRPIMIRFDGDLNLSEITPYIENVSNVSILNNL